MLKEIEIPFDIGAKVCHINFCTGRIEHTVVTSSLASTITVGGTKTDYVIYITADGYSFVNVIGEPKMTDLFENYEAVIRFFDTFKIQKTKINLRDIK